MTTQKEISDFNAVFDYVVNKAGHNAHSSHMNTGKEYRINEGTDDVMIAFQGQGHRYISTNKVSPDYKNGNIHYGRGTPEDLESLRDGLGL